MQTVTLLVVAFLFLVSLKLLKVFLDRKQTTPFLYEAKPSLMTESEKIFYKTLKEVVDNRYDIFPQVSVMELVRIPKGLAFKQKTLLKNKIQAKHVDFVLCEKETTQPVLVIELDGWNHEEKKTQERDRFLRELWSSVNLPFLSVSTQTNYIPSELERDIKIKLGILSG
ncbi:MAG: DUF2726 domain-containing protein [Patescibacteria group bacterium]